MKQYVLEEFKDKFSEIGSRIEIGEHPMLSGIIKEWTQLGVTIIELSEKNEPVNISLSIDNTSLCSGIDFGRESFDLPGYIIGKDLCVQGIEGKINLESVSTEELVKELSSRYMDSEEIIEKWAKPLREHLIEAYNLYTKIVISTEGVRVIQDIKGIPYTSQG